MDPSVQIPPPQTQTMSDSPTEPACSNTPLGEMKIPEPMMFPKHKSNSVGYLHTPVDEEIKLQLHTF